MKAVSFLVVLSLCGIALRAQENEPSQTAAKEISLVLEVIGYHPRFSKTWFENPTGERWEIYHDLLRFRVLVPKEHAKEEFELFLPSMGGTYRAPTVEFRERITVPLHSAAFTELLGCPRPEYEPIRSPAIERAVHSALLAQKKTGAAIEQPAP